MIDKLHLTLENRVLKAAEALYSGETIQLELTNAELTELTAANYRFILFGGDRRVLASSAAFTATGCTWTASLNTATEAFQTYYENVTANSVKTLGMMIADNTTGDVLCAGTVPVTCVPFPTQMNTIPNLYADGFIRHNEMEAYCSGILGDVEAVLNQILGIEQTGE